jgi:hypothetical protein
MYNIKLGNNTFHTRNWKDITYASYWYESKIYYLVYYIHNFLLNTDNRYD